MADTWFHNNKELTAAGTAAIAGGVTYKKTGDIVLSAVVAATAGAGSYLVLDATHTPPAKATTRSISLGDVGDVGIKDDQESILVELKINKDELPNGVNAKALERLLKQSPRHKRAEMARRLIEQAAEAAKEDKKSRKAS